MDRLIRRRAVSGLVGLLALSLSLVEAGAASMCDPSMPMDHDVEVAADTATGMSGHMASSDHTTHPEGEQVAEDGTDPAPCPWMPMMGAGCSAPVVVPPASPGFGTAGDCVVQSFRASRDLATLHSTD